jgi:hypothetical protein
MNDSIHKQGWKDILLGSSLESIRRFVIPFDQSKLKDSMFVTPEKDAWFVYADMPHPLRDMPGITIKNVLIVVSKESIIKKIKLYISDEENQMNFFLKKRFGDTLIGGKSSLNNNQHFMWHTSKDVLLYFFTTKESYYFPEGSNSELIFSFVKDANEFGKYIVRPRFKKSR